MTLQHSPCNYHKEKIAVTKCTRCNRSICLEDKRIYEYSMSSGTGNHSRPYVVNQDYCLVCYYNQLEKDNTPGLVDVFIYVFLAVWILFALNIFFPFAIFGIYAVLQHEKNKKEMKEKESEARVDLKNFQTSFDTPAKLETNLGLSKKTRIDCFEVEPSLNLLINFV